jgi:hypothetical protein
MAHPAVAAAFRVRRYYSNLKSFYSYSVKECTYLLKKTFNRMFVQFFSKLLGELQPCSTYRRTAAIFFSYWNGSFLNAEVCIMFYQVRTATGSSKVWLIHGGLYSDYGVFGLWYLAVLSVFPNSKLPVYGELKWTCFEGSCMEGGHPVPQQENRRLSSPGRQKGHTRKSKISRNLCPCKLYDKEFNSFYLLTKISYIFRR